MSSLAKQHALSNYSWSKIFDSLSSTFTSLNMVREQYHAKQNWLVSLICLLSKCSRTGLLKSVLDTIIIRNEDLTNIPSNLLESKATSFVFKIVRF